MIGEIVQFFTIQKELGSGGMATVYLAENNIGKKVAIKVLHKEYFHNEQIRKRFAQEAKVMASMEHDNICPAISLEDNDEFSAIIMEYLEGQDLKSYVGKHGAVPEAKVMGWLRQIAPALNYAHSKGYVHRDIKPSNFLLTTKGQIKIMDFGIAKAEDSKMRTKTDSKMGSVVYMSPEQIKSPKYVDNRTDIYSLGVTLYHLLSGKVPYDTTTQSEFVVMTKITQEDLPQLLVSEKMNTIIRRATKKDRNDRPEKVAGLLGAGAAVSDKTVIEEKFKSDETIVDARGRSADETVSETNDLDFQEKTSVYTYVGDFSEGLAVVRKGSHKDGKGGFIDKSGHTVIPLVYDYAGSFSEGLARVRKGGKWGFIDKSGNTVIPLVYGIVGSFSEGLAVVRKDGKRGFIDKSGNTVIPFVYHGADSFSEGLAMVEKDGKEGFIDKSGNTVIPLVYDYAGSFSEGLAEVRKDGKWGFIDKSGNTVIPFVYDIAWSFSEGLAMVRKDGKWGFIDKSGHTVIPLVYDFARSFSEGLALVEKGSYEDGKWGFIDKSGNTVIPLVYDWAGSFSEGLAMVVKDGKWFYIDRQGNYVKD